jgi:hypothetical protein
VPVFDTLLPCQPRVLLFDYTLVQYSEERCRLPQRLPCLSQARSREGNRRGSPELAGVVQLAHCPKASLPLLQQYPVLAVQALR